MGPGTMAATVTENTPISIPNISHLELSGTNWAIFSLWFQKAIKANQKWGHFDRSSMHPAAVDPDKPTDDEKAVQAEWDWAETVAKYLLS
jgi:hypothetical protein